MNLIPEHPALDGAPRSRLPFSPCVKVGHIVFVSSQATLTGCLGGALRSEIDCVAVARGPEGHTP